MDIAVIGTGKLGSALGPALARAGRPLRGSACPPAARRPLGDVHAARIGGCRR